jgi:hypothetical protein
MHYNLITIMEEPTLYVTNGRYPFGSEHLKAKVEEVQQFSSETQLREKKVEMLKKSEMVMNPSIVRMTCIAEQGKALVYFY